MYFPNHHLSLVFQIYKLPCFNSCFAVVAALKPGFMFFFLPGIQLSGRVAECQTISQDHTSDESQGASINREKRQDLSCNKSNGKHSKSQDHAFVNVS